MKSLLAVAAVLSFAACGGAAIQGESAESDDQELVIGISAPFSGPYGSTGPDISQGAELALSELGNKFGDMPVVFKEFDDKVNPATAIEVAHQAVTKEGVHLMLGPAFTSAGVAAVEIYTEAKLPQVIIGTAEAVVGEAAPYAFRNMYNPNDQIELLADYLVETLGARKVGVVALNDGNFKVQSERAVDVLKEKGIDEPVLALFNEDETDLTASLSPVMAPDVDAILALVEGPGAATMLKTLRQGGRSTPVAGYSGMALRSQAKLTDPADIENVVMGWHCQFTEGFLTERSEKFLENVRQERWGGGQFEEVALLQSLGYDTIYLARQAFEAGGGKATREAMYEGLTSITDFDGVNGRMDFSSSREGWQVDNLIVAQLDSWSPERGTYTAAEGVERCGLSK